VVPLRSQQVRVRHDEPQLRPNGATAAKVMSAMELVSTVEGLRTISIAVGDRYRVDGRDDADGVVVRLKRKSAATSAAS
jgi:hypothetical protein